MRLVSVTKQECVIKNFVEVEHVGHTMAARQHTGSTAMLARLIRSRLCNSTENDLLIFRIPLE